MDRIVKAYSVGDVDIPDAVTGFFDGINGLVGFFNAILFLLGPVLLVVWAQPRANHRGDCCKSSAAKPKTKPAMGSGSTR